HPCLGPTYHSGIRQTVEQEALDGDDTWLTVGVDEVFYYEQVALLAGQRSLSGVQLTADEDFWLDAYGHTDENIQIFDRKGHITFSDIGKDDHKIRLPYPNRINITFGCNDKLVREQVDYVISLTSLKNHSCLEKIKTIRYPLNTFYVYKMQSL